MADGKIVIDVILEDGKVAKGVAQLDKSVTGLAGAGRRAAAGIKEIAVSLGLVALASKAISAVTNAFDGAISRYDTLNNFPRVLQMIGFSAEDSERAINRLSDGIQGLPTALDEVAGTAQRLAVMTGDLDGAVETTLALNNAFLASGANAADASRGLEQYVQMLSTGTVDLQSWRTLQETMGVALNDVAKAFGYTGASAQNDLYDALKDGHITFDEFNAKIIELSNETGGFADRALTASGGIRTAWTNMGTAIVRGVTNVIESIDGVLSQTRFGSIENIIKGIGDAFFFALDSMAQVISGIPGVINSIREALEPWAPLLKVIGSLLVGVVAGLMAFKGVLYIQSLAPMFIKLAGAISLLRNPVFLLQYAFVSLQTAILANPIAWIAAAIVGLGAAFVYAYKNSEPFRQSVQRLGNVLKNTFGKAIDKASDLIKTLKERFDDFAKTKGVDIMERLAGVVDRVADTINRAFSGDFGGMAEMFGKLLPSIIGAMVGGIPALVLTGAKFLPALADGIQQNLPMVLNTIENVITSMINGVTTYLPIIIETGVEILVSLIQGILDAIPMILPVIVTLVTTIITVIAENLPVFIQAGVDILMNIIQGLVNSIPLIVDAVLQLLTNFITLIVENLPLIIQAGIEIVMALIEGITALLPELITAAIEILQTIVTTIIDNLPQIIEAGIEILEALIDGILGILPDLIKTGVGLIIALAGALIDNLPKIIEAGINILLALIDGIMGMLPDLIKTGIELIFELAATLIGHLPEIIKAGVEIVFAIIDGIIDALPDLLAQGVSLIADLAGEMIAAIPGLIWDVGTSIVEGIWEGIKRAGGWLKDKVGGFFGGIIDWGKGALGINSPSIEMERQIGRWLPAGIGVGIEKYSKPALDSVRRLARQLTDEAQVEFGVTNRLRGARFSFSDIIPGSITASVREVKTVAQDGITSRKFGQLVTSIRELASRPVSVQVNGREIVYATVEDMDREIRFRRERDDNFK